MDATFLDISNKDLCRNDLEARDQTCKLLTGFWKRASTSLNFSILELKYLASLPQAWWPQKWLINKQTSCILSALGLQEDILGFWEVCQVTLGHTTKLSKCCFYCVAFPLIP